MSVAGFLLVLTAAFCHATWNYLVKRINGGPELIWLFSLVSVAIYLPFAVAGWRGSNLAVAAGWAAHVGWDIALYVNNIGDEDQRFAIDQERGTRARVGYLVGQPRTYGIVARANF